MPEINNLNKLIRKASMCVGMVSEARIKCMIIKEKMKNSEDHQNALFEQEILKIRQDVDKYSSRLIRIKKDLQKYGTIN